MASNQQNIMPIYVKIQHKFNLMKLKKRVHDEQRWQAQQKKLIDMSKVNQK